MKNGILDEVGQGKVDPLGRALHAARRRAGFKDDLCPVQQGKGRKACDGPFGDRVEVHLGVVADVQPVRARGQKELRHCAGQRLDVGPERDQGWVVFQTVQPRHKDRDRCPQGVRRLCRARLFVFQFVVQTRDGPVDGVYQILDLGRKILVPERVRGLPRADLPDPGRRVAHRSKISPPIRFAGSARIAK